MWMAVSSSSCSARGQPEKWLRASRVAARTAKPEAMAIGEAARTLAASGHSQHVSQKVHGHIEVPLTRFVLIDDGGEVDRFAGLAERTRNVAVLTLAVVTFSGADILGEAR